MLVKLNDSQNVHFSCSGWKKKTEDQWPCFAPECIGYADLEQAWKYMTKQIWPYHKNGQGQPIWTNLVVLEYLMLYTKFQGHQPLGYKDDFLRFLPYVGLEAILCLVSSAWEKHFNYIEVDYNNTWPCCKPICCFVGPKHLYFSNLGYLMPDLRVSAMKKSEIWPFWRNQEWSQIWP